MTVHFLCFFIFIITNADARVEKKVDLRLPQQPDQLWSVTKPDYSKAPKKEPKIKVRMKSSIPKQMLSNQAENIDPQPYRSDSALPNVRGTLKDSTNSVDVKVRF